MPMSAAHSTQPGPWPAAETGQQKTADQLPMSGPASARLSSWQPGPREPWGSNKKLLLWLNARLARPAPLLLCCCAALAYLLRSELHGDAECVEILS
jgi:hypothetical protein